MLNTTGHKRTSKPRAHVASKTSRAPEASRALGTSRASGADTKLTALRAERNERAAALFKAAVVALDSERERIHQKIVVEYLDVAEAIARRYSKRSHESSDIRQVACVGLVKAVRRFDFGRGDDFVSFAVPTISGEIKRHLRDNGWFIRPPRHIQELHSLLLTEVPRMTQELGRSPAPREIARNLGESTDRVSEALNCQASLRPVSLDVGVHDDGNLTLGDTLGVADLGLERVELNATLRAACLQLTVRQRRILYLRFFKEQTQTEIARELGVTQMQVSRLLTQIMDRLRNELTSETLVA